ncbi:MAG: phospho-sugar mutase [Bacilli bacterium]|nr:phospho-sugar mutase [Bacilli bacterium]
MIERYYEWLNNEYIDNEDKKILKNMSKEEIEESFYENLSFGTAGIRGKMGLGSNKINKYTIGKVTVGLSNYLNKKYDNPSVVIAYDTRNNSKDFALETALILNYYGIKTYLFKEVTSTPELSYSVKYLNTQAGIVITSSHNSKEYNGYKVYNALGGQIVAPEDELIINEINNINSLKLIKTAPLNNELFNYVDDNEHISFVNENKKVIIDNELIKKYSKDINITYSSLHGVGLKTAKEIFNDLGFNYNIVKEQCTYDGDFKTAPEPNPEYIDNYKLSIENAKENNSDIILMTDPDADRIGVMYKNNNNEYKLINGDFLGALFSYYIVNNTDIKDNSYMIRSIVTSPLIDKIAKSKNIDIYEVLTGCKNIASMKNTLKDKNYIFGYEESLGYMFNIDVNDKNGFSSMICILEILCYCKNNHITLEDYINRIYSEFGYNFKETLSFVSKNVNYKDIINNLMNKFRNNEFKFKNNNYTIIDYTKKSGGLKTNALKYIFKNDSYIIIRPSGTEPKIKVYVGACDEEKENAIDKINILINDVNSLINID